MPFKPKTYAADTKAESREAKKALLDVWHLPIEDFPVDGQSVEGEVDGEFCLVKHVNGTWQLAETTHPITVVRPTRWRGYRNDRAEADYPKGHKPPLGSPAREVADKAESKPV